MGGLLPANGRGNHPLLPIPCWCWAEMEEMNPLFKHGFIVSQFRSFGSSKPNSNSKAAVEGPTTTGVQEQVEQFVIGNSIKFPKAFWEWVGGWMESSFNRLLLLPTSFLPINLYSPVGESCFLDDRCWMYLCALYQPVTHHPLVKIYGIIIPEG